MTVRIRTITTTEYGKVLNLLPAKNDCQKTFITCSEQKLTWNVNMDVVAILKSFDSFLSLLLYAHF